MQKGTKGRNIAWISGGGLLFLVLLFLLSHYLAREGSGGRIGLVTIEGVIMDSKEAIEQLDKFRNNQTIKALVIRINSPGGGAAAAQEIYGELNKVRSQLRKPVVASIGSLGASGGYYVACASDRIFANPGSITGSIGVIMQLSNISRLLEKVGVQSAIIKSGDHKDMGSTVKDLSPGDQKIFQEVLDDVHDQFIEAVAKGRKMDKGRVREIADGRIYTGRQALNLGLVDEMGSLSDAILYAARLAGIKGKPKVVEERKRRFSFLDFLGSRIFSFSSATSPIPWQSLSIQYLMR